MKPLSHTTTRHLGVEALVATFQGCDFHVDRGEEMTVDLPDGPFTGKVSTFNIERISLHEIRTNVTIVRSSAWGKILNVLGGRTVHGVIEHR